MSTGHVDKAPFWCSPIGLVLCGFLAIGALLVLLEHQAHVLGLWPLLSSCIAGTADMAHTAMAARGRTGIGGEDER